MTGPTEQRHPQTANLDRMSVRQLLATIHGDDSLVPAAVGSALPAIEDAVGLAVAAIRANGRVHYFGAGSSGRYGYLDAIEIPPTYGMYCFVPHIAGGIDAMTRAVEGAEDDEATGWDEGRSVASMDLVVGLAASGGTAYVGGALRAARETGVPTVLLSSNPEAKLRALADVHVLLDTGPEVVMGSTRMKAGTAMKVALHTFSTAVMVVLGRTYSNLMVELVASNAKLRARRLRIVVEATGAAPERCAAAIAEADDEPRTAVVAILAGCTADHARAALHEADQMVSVALAALAARR